MANEARVTLVVSWAEWAYRLVAFAPECFPVWSSSGPVMGGLGLTACMRPVFLGMSPTLYLWRWTTYLLPSHPLFSATILL